MVMGIEVNGPAAYRSANGVSSRRQRHGRDDTDRRHLLNALSHRSGVGDAVDGRRLHFHLAGINNQNFIMQDEETGTWWQQVTGGRSSVR